MSKKPKVLIKKEVLDWAINESELPIGLLYSQLDFFTKLMNGEPITVKQVERLSKKLMVPFGSLFLNEPPDKNAFDVEFRTIRNKQNKSLSKNLRDTIFDMDNKKDWINEYRKTNEFNRFLFSNILKNPTNVNECANKVRKTLKLDGVNWFNLVEEDNTFSFLRERAEEIGFVVMVNGIVGENTGRSLELNEFRGFVLNGEYAPLVFINGKDNNKSKSFTLLHEIIHVFMSADDDIISDDILRVESERTINEIVAEILMPEVEVRSFARNPITNTINVKRIASHFKVNPLAMAFRLENLNLIDDWLYHEVEEESNRLLNERTASGGSYINNVRFRLSKSFVESVINSMYSNQIAYTEGYRLLGVKNKGFAILSQGV